MTRHIDDDALAALHPKKLGPAGNHANQKDWLRDAVNIVRKMLPFAPLTPEQMKRLRPLTKRQRRNVMRHEPCACGSGKKFKRCCWHRYRWD